MEVAALHNSNDPHEYARMCRRLVENGFTPYGKPYTHGSYLIREFVKYEYDIVEPDFEFEEDEEVNTNGDPWEDHDFFEGIDNE